MALGRRERQTTTAATKKERKKIDLGLRGAGLKSQEAGSCRKVVVSSKSNDAGGRKPPITADWRKERQSRIRKEPTVAQNITFVGLDAHKQSISISMLLPDRTTAVEWEIPNEPAAVRRMVRKVEREAPGEVRFCYEAGPCGYALQRQITEAGESSCMVVAPSLIPVKPGERVKTDRRDARKLAELFRAGLLTEVQPPTEADEAVRDLCRAREDAKADLLRARHRLAKMLLRRGLIYRGGKSSWTSGYMSWLKSLRFDHKLDQAVFDDYLLGIEQVQERVRGLDEKLEEVSRQAPYVEAVSALRCFRGIDTVIAMTIVSELHTFGRFESARGLMAYLGLVPSEHSSGDRTRRGAITKAGNSHVRRVLIEAAWNYRHRPALGRRLKKRRDGQPSTVTALADRAMQRLYRRYTRMTNARIPAAKAVVAVARELVGFIWAALYPLATARAN
jgi:transposase